jgi:hypothetical protein
MPSTIRLARITPLAQQVLHDGGWHSTVEVQLLILKQIPPERIVAAGRSGKTSPFYKALTVEEQIKRGLRKMATDTLNWMVKRGRVQRTKTQDGHDRWRLAPVQVSAEEQSLNTAVTQAAAVWARSGQAAAVAKPKP